MLYLQPLIYEVYKDKVGGSDGHLLHLTHVNRTNI